MNDVKRDKWGNKLCQHNGIARRCNKPGCNGLDICIHHKRKSRCAKCGGSELCVHRISKYFCIPCKGAGTCKHKKITRRCEDCRPVTYYAHNATQRIHGALKADQESPKYRDVLGMSIKEYKVYIENQFKPGMTWDNYGFEWEIDHKIAIAFKLRPDDELNIEEVTKRLHYKNTQPLWTKENRYKAAKTYSEEYAGVST